jgi:hypothetical protein
VLRKPRSNANTHVVGKAVGHQKHDGVDLQKLDIKGRTKKSKDRDGQTKEKMTTVDILTNGVE